MLMHFPHNATWINYIQIVAMVENHTYVHMYTPRKYSTEYLELGEHFAYLFSPVLVGGELSLVKKDLNKMKWRTHYNHRSCVVVSMLQQISLNCLVVRLSALTVILRSRSCQG
jgi:hypothetical protein